MTRQQRNFSVHTSTDCVIKQAHFQLEDSSITRQTGHPTDPKPRSLPILVIIREANVATAFALIRRSHAATAAAAVSNFYYAFHEQNSNSSTPQPLLTAAISHRRGSQPRFVVSTFLPARVALVIDVRPTDR